MSTNLSKQRREELLEKLNQIETFVEENSKDENVRLLLTNIAEIRKDINGKKFGLLFEEHEESIDNLLEKIPLLLLKRENYLLTMVEI